MPLEPGDPIFGCGHKLVRSVRVADPGGGLLKEMTTKRSPPWYSRESSKNGFCCSPSVSSQPLPTSKVSAGSNSSVTYLLPGEREYSPDSGLALAPHAHAAKTHAANNPSRSEYATAPRCTFSLLPYSNGSHEDGNRTYLRYSTNFAEFTFHDIGWIALSYQAGTGGYSVSYLRPIAAIFSKSSGVGGGGGVARSLPGIPASSKNPSKPAGVTNSNVLAGSVLAFLQACSVPMRMRNTDPAFAWNVRSPSKTSNSPSSRQ